ncbi:hypothetical protein GCM10009801_72920 [Streptomyces albiaxialis]|uniref:Uncharacterized protein n=1 Tax=Streptomyces albiaxialis TaxID=329523 RepID=A0ABN2WXM8_9ACTN
MSPGRLRRPVRRVVRELLTAAGPLPYADLVTRSTVRADRVTTALDSLVRSGWAVRGAEGYRLTPDGRGWAAAALAGTREGRATETEANDQRGAFEWTLWLKSDTDPTVMLTGLTWAREEDAAGAGPDDLLPTVLENVRARYVQYLSARVIDFDARWLTADEARAARRERERAEKADRESEARRPKAILLMVAGVCCPLLSKPVEWLGIHRALVSSVGGFLGAVLICVGGWLLITSLAGRRSGEA